MQHERIKLIIWTFYLKRRVSFSHLHSHHYNWWKNLGLKIWTKSILALSDRKLTCAASHLHVINTHTARKQSSTFSFKACAVLLILLLLWQNLAAEITFAPTTWMWFQNIYKIINNSEGSAKSGNYQKWANWKQVIMFEWQSSLEDTGPNPLFQDLKEKSQLEVKETAGVDGRMKVNDQNDEVAVWWSNWQKRH